ncbi:MAG TPA: hypothetical protein VM759_13485, partial [Longimicrobium sp.]|nr:hypothetical protein [Longimicrobium sp.]
DTAANCISRRNDASTISRSRSLSGPCVPVALLEQFLGHARLREAYSAELDGYWAGGDVQARAAALSPLLDALDRVLESGVHRLPPFVLTP